jgi:hypothetical protein
MANVVPSAQVPALLQGVLAPDSEIRCVFLVGAGFSREAGVPTGKEIVDILAERRLHLHKASNKQEASNKAEEMSAFLERMTATPPVPGRAAKELGRRMPEYKGLAYEVFYERLFADALLFPTHVQRRKFFEVLLKLTTRAKQGYNMEGVFLAAILRGLRATNPALAHVVITTNFDDVVETSFGKLGLPFREFESPEWFLRDRDAAPLPAVVHLHGRFTQYRLINTPADMRNPAHKKQVREVLRQLSPQSCLIVIGYAGWEDAVMGALLPLVKAGAFVGGVFWSTKDTFTEALPLVQKLAEYPNVTVVENTRALRFMRGALTGAGVPLSSIVYDIRTALSDGQGDFERRWLALEHGDREVEPFETEGKGSVEGLAREGVRYAEQALRDGRLAGIAFECLDAAARDTTRDKQVKDWEIAQARAALRTRFTANPHGALFDYHLALRAGTERQTEVWLGLAELYRALGKKSSCLDALRRAALAAKGEGRAARARLNLATAEKIFQIDNNLTGATRLIRKASQGFLAGAHPDYHMAARCQYVYGNLLLFNNHADEALGRADTALQYARKAGSTVAECEAKYLMGVAYLYKNSLTLSEEVLLGAQRLAEEGPQFRMLGNIALNQGELLFRKGPDSLALATQRYDQAARFCRLAGNEYTYFQAVFARDLCRTYSMRESPLHADHVAALRSALREFSQFEDWAMSAVLWSDLALACCVRQPCDHGADLLNECLAQAEGSVEKLGAELGPGERLRSVFQRHDPNARLVAHVRQMVLLATIMGTICFPAHEPMRADELLHLRELYGKWRRLWLRHDHPSPLHEVLHAILAGTLLRLGVIEFGRLVPYSFFEGPSQFELGSVRSFCVRRQYWNLRILVDRPCRVAG